MKQKRIIRTETISRPGAAITVQRIIVAPWFLRALCIGRAKLPKAKT